jgi:hypothetical protein
MVPASAITPNRKRKSLAEGSAPSRKDPDSVEILSSRGSDLSELDFVQVLPLKEESLAGSPGNQLSAMIRQWDVIVNGVNKMTGTLKQLGGYTIDELDSLEEKLLGVEAKIGTPGSADLFEDCGTVWDGLTLLQSKLSLKSQAVFNFEQTCNSLDASIDTRIDAKLAAAQVQSSREMSALGTGLKEVAEFVNLLHQEMTLMNLGPRGDN